MITGFNPADMYGVDHIRRVLRTFPGVFSGIGEFTIHKEFVSSKVAGETASLTNPALDRILEFAAEVGPRGSDSQRPRHAVREVQRRARLPHADEGGAAASSEDLDHLGARRDSGVSCTPSSRRRRWPPPSGPEPSRDRRSLLSDPAFSHVHFDISWDEVAKYMCRTPETVRRTLTLINRHPDRFLFGTDNVAPSTPEAHFAVFEQYTPLWKALTPQTSQKVRLTTTCGCSTPRGPACAPGRRNQGK